LLFKAKTTTPPCPAFPSLVREKGARRVLVLGCAGVGKTHFSRALAEAINAPVICLDALWRDCADDEALFLAQVKALHDGAAWVSDGNFAAVTFALRLPRAELVIWLDAPRWLCVWRACTRVLAPGEHHRLRDLGDVLRFIRNFDRINRPRIDALLAAQRAQIPRRTLTTSRAARAFLAEAGRAP
jgi:hypothetical protein